MRNDPCILWAKTKGDKRRPLCTIERDEFYRFFTEFREEPFSFK
jgi:hypothetical protein